ncbi:MAG: universal stress protein [Bacteroidetes bacterium]|nr:universal stress protein [Bacteroidota bacterium]
MNSISSKIILVPVDYTERAVHAIGHALVMARLFGYRINLLHVITKKVDKDDEAKAQKKIGKFAADFYKKSGVEIQGIVREGSIFTTIGETANEIKADLILMGIHGKKGLQHLFGSFAYKVICSSSVPVAVVKNPLKKKNFENIVLPIDFSKESTIKVNQAIKYAHYFGASIRIIGILDTKSTVMKIHKEALLKKVMDYIKSAGVNVTADVLIQPGSDVHKATLKYADDIDADMIIIVAEKEGGLSDIFSKNSAEEIIDKAEMPVMTIIPNPDEKDFSDSQGKIVKSFVDPLGLIKN